MPWRPEAMLALSEMWAGFLARTEGVCADHVQGRLDRDCRSRMVRQMRRGLLSRRFDSLSRNGIFGGVFSGPTEARHSACSLCHSGQVMGLSQESRSDVVHQVQRQTGDLRGAALPLPSCVRWCPREQAVNATTSLTGTKSKNLAEVRHLHFPCYCSVLNAVGGARSLSRERQGLVLVRSPFRSTKKRGNARDRRRRGRRTVLVRAEQPSMAQRVRIRARAGLPLQDVCALSRRSPARAWDA